MDTREHFVCEDEFDFDAMNCAHNHRNINMRAEDEDYELEVGEALVDDHQPWAAHPIGWGNQLVVQRVSLGEGVNNFTLLHFVRFNNLALSPSNTRFR